MGKTIISEDIFPALVDVYNREGKTSAYDVNALLGCHDLDLSCCREIARVAVIECSQ